NCKVSWHLSHPHVEHTPAILHRSGRESHSAAFSIDLGPGEIAVFDYLRVNQETGRWVIACDWDPNGLEIKPQPYEVQLIASGEDVPSQTQTLLILPGPEKSVHIIIKSGKQLKRNSPI